MSMERNARILHTQDLNAEKSQSSRAVGSSNHEYYVLLVLWEVLDQE